MTTMRALRTAQRVLRGRSDQLGLALGVLRQTRKRAAGGLILISGPAGIGKTALLTEVLRQARVMGYRVGSSKCDEIEQIWPGAPIVAALRSGREPILTSPQYEDLLTTQPLVLAERIAAHLEQVSRNHLLLLAVDDVQWADRVSRFVLRTVLTRTVGLPIVIVLASRDAAVADELTALQDGAAVEHIELAPLTTEDVLAIAQDRLGRAPDEHMRRLLLMADGNPFLITHFLDSDADVVATVQSRLSQLSPPAVELIQLVAVAGRPLPVAALTALSHTHDGIQPAMESGLVTKLKDQLAFRHDLVREAVYESIDDGQRRGLHKLFAEYFLTHAREPLMAASHARAAAKPGDAAVARVLVEAAECLAIISAEDAGELAALGFSVVRPSHPEWLAISRRCLTVLSRTQRPSDAIGVADLIAARVDDPNIAGEIEIDMSRALWLSGEPERLITRVDALLRQRTALSRHIQARLDAARALARTRTTTGDVAAAEAETALAAARTSQDAEALSLALQACGEAAKNEGRHHESLRYFRELSALSGASYLSEEIMALQLVDRYEHAQTLLDQINIDNAERVESALPSLIYAQLWQDFNLGRLDEAESGAQALIDLGRQIGTNMHALEAIMIRSAVSLLQGEPSTAARRLEPAASLTAADDNIRLPGLTLMGGWIAAVNGDIGTALTILRPVLYAARESRTYWAWWPGWMSVFFHIGCTGHDPDFAAEAVAVAELGAERNPGVTSFEGLALNLRARLGNDMGMLARAATLLGASPRPALRALGAESYGQALLAAGEKSAGLEQLDKAWDEYDAMRAWAGRANVQRLMRDAGARRERWSTKPSNAKSGWTSLTEGERRVATLIAEGHTNKSAAKTLGISINTVGTHLRAVFAKLGIRSRVQLANALHDKHLVT
jgi:DNA-binding CsgD family transcriptional regulator/nucleoside-triphosphatase THEP1